jgi:hypothetical protein
MQKLSCKLYQSAFINKGFEQHLRLLPGEASWEKYYGIIERPSWFAASAESMWQ